jgi:hypothetical protein
MVIVDKMKTKVGAIAKEIENVMNFQQIKKEIPCPRENIGFLGHYFFRRIIRIYGH